MKRTTGNCSSDVPFLRTQINAMKLAKTNSSLGMYNSVGAGTFQTSQERLEALQMRRLARKETGWDNNFKPISKYNSKVHSSMRIPFEQI